MRNGSLALLSLVLTACGTGMTGTDTVADPTDAASDTDVASDTDGAEETDLERMDAAQLRAALLAAGAEPMPAAPAQSMDLVELGRLLAFDKEFGGNRDTSCMTCHQPTLGTGDDRRLPIGTGGVGVGQDRIHPDGTLVPRNAPAMYNLHALDTMFWDTRIQWVGTASRDMATPAGDDLTPAMEAVLELGPAAAQAMFPVTSREEMRGHEGENEVAAYEDTDFAGMWEDLIGRAVAIPVYVDLFERAYPQVATDDLTWAHAAQAIAAFEVTAFDASNTPYDQFLRGDLEALDAEARQGAAIFFGRGGCSTCHTGVALTDEQTHNTGLCQYGPGKGHGPSGRDDLGRYGVSGEVTDLYAFRTPPLRNAVLTAPYGHAGQFETLEDYVTHYVDPTDAMLNYDAGQLDPDLAESIVDNSAQVIAALDADLPVLDAEDVAPLVAFLVALTDERSVAPEQWIPGSVPSGLPVED